MTTKTRVLTLLETQRGLPISGEEMAGALGVSRAAVWKAIKELQKEGHAIDAAPHRGYTLCATSEVLCAEGIRPYLNDGNALLVVEPVLESTNLTARQLAEQGAPHGTLVVADAQTGGRGRLGRSFSSPPGTGLYLTMVLRPNLPMERAVHITGAAAVAVCRAVQQVCGKELAIKWVNDLYRNGKKCGGILTQATANMETGGVDYVVVGIGLNVWRPADGFGPELEPIATALLEPGEPVRRCQLAAAIANELLALADALPNTAFMQEYRARNLVPGHDVTVLQNGTARPAHALAITDEGHLLVRTEAGEEVLSFGEISVRVQA